MSRDKNYGPDKIVPGTYSSHAAAQHAVDVLASHRFPVEHITIELVGDASMDGSVGGAQVGEKEPRDLGRCSSVAGPP